ncbi:MAG TPA: cytochrome o ubiquinol oxidase subunit IV [Candidatus Paceibacterota bacterium]
MTKVSGYIVGFLLSILLTLMAAGLALQYGKSYEPLMGPGVMYAMLVVLAVLQLLVQLYFFLHLGEEKKPRWNALALCFALMVVAILVGGTLWIMHNLSHGQMAQLPFIEGAITPQASND